MLSEGLRKVCAICERCQSAHPRTLGNHLLTISGSLLTGHSIIEQEPDMGTILFECPKTGRPVSTGIETQPISFCRLSETWLEVYCPLCGHFHGAKVWLAEETFLHCASAKALRSEQDQIESYTRRNVSEINRAPTSSIPKCTPMNGLEPHRADHGRPPCNTATEICFGSEADFSTAAKLVLFSGPITRRQLASAKCH